jgi:hypothetical protein
MALKGLARFGNVHPQATLSADGARSLNDETEGVSLLGWRGQVNEAPGYIGSSIILQWEQKDLTRAHREEQSDLERIARVQENLYDSPYFHRES